MQFNSHNPNRWPPGDDVASGSPGGRRRGRQHHPEGWHEHDGGPEERPETRHGFGGPVFGPGFPGVPGSGGPRGGGRFGGRGEGRRGDGRRGGGRGRAQRGDVRTTTLLLLAEQPMHGYQLMQAMDERTGGAWRPSPGAIYPTISQLEDEGLVTTLAEGGRKLVTLTEAGHAHVEEQRSAWGDPFAELSAQESDGPDLRAPLEAVHVAARQISHHGTAAQSQAAAKVLADARRALYLILAELGDDGDG